jgi:hypothetical protein
MRIGRDQSFDTERRRFALLHCCEDCGLFDPRQETCAHEWPLTGHRRADYDAPGPDILFCKEFEAC